MDFKERQLILAKFEKNNSEMMKSPFRKEKWIETMTKILCIYGLESKRGLDTKKVWVEKYVSIATLYFSLTLTPLPCHSQA